MEKILFFIMLFIFTANALFAWIFGLKSLSDMWYFLNEYDKKNKTYWRYLFPISTMIYATLLIVIGIQFTELALFGLALSYVAFAPQFETLGAPKISHFFGAAIAVIGSQIMIISLGYLWLTIAFLVLTLASYMFDKKKLTYWAEIFAFYSVALTYYLLIYGN